MVVRRGESEGNSLEGSRALADEQSLEFLGAELRSDEEEKAKLRAPDDA